MKWVIVRTHKASLCASGTQITRLCQPYVKFLMSPVEVANKTLGWERVMLDASFSFGVPEEKDAGAAAKRISALPHLKEALVEPP